MGRRTFYRVVLGLLLVALWGIARPSFAQDLYSIGSAGTISSHNVSNAHVGAPRSNGRYGLTKPLRINEVIANTLEPDSAIYVIPTIGIGTHGSAPAILFEGRF